MNLFAYVGNNPINAVDPEGLEAIPWGTITSGATTVTTTAAAPALGILATAGSIVLGMPSEVADATLDANSDKQCKENNNCPPCSPYPVGSIGYQGPEVHKTGRDSGESHYHLFEVQQIPSNCKCIWKERTKAISGDHHYYDQPNIYYSINLNSSGRPPRYPQ